MTDITKSDQRLTIRVLIALLLAVIVTALLVWQFGAPALVFVALAATVLVFVIMLAFTAGK